MAQRKRLIRSLAAGLGTVALAIITLPESSIVAVALITIAFLAVTVESYLPEENEGATSEGEEKSQSYGQLDRKMDQLDRKYDQLDRKMDQLDRKYDQLDRKMDQLDREFELQSERTSIKEVEESPSSVESSSKESEKEYER
ncbi:hypothetical protein [Halorubrum sp. Eb13]|uniref:hypothetical protein n=1 Tax=Halorubrum sp. Eb13 TaxID=1383843 RepID=UPI0011402B84|nr:hypothetical protein [Halorubrum sp. Eb13]